MTLTTTWRIPVAIDIKPWFQDHRFDGRVILPAVETMSLLAEQTAGVAPEITLQFMENVRFARFLEIPAGSNKLDALIEFQRHADGSLLVGLFSRIQGKVMTRLQGHGEILFSSTREILQQPPSPARQALTNIELSIPAEQIYRELVPFGPGFHTLRDALFIAGRMALGRLRAPSLPLKGGAAQLLGSPFPLDGAFHAACVLGQRYADFVPFPVGFSRRIIYQATQPGKWYYGQTELLAITREELLFDLSIVNEREELCEQVTGLRMRDVSGGKIKSPEWIRMRN